MNDVPARRPQTDTTEPTPRAKHEPRMNGLGESERPPDDALAVDRELDDVRTRLSAELRQLRPDLFDDSGRPKKGALEKLINDRTGKKYLTKADILRITRTKSG